MKRTTVLRALGFFMVLVLLAASLGTPASAQDQSPDGGALLETSSASVGAPTSETFASYDAPPPLTEEQAARLKWAEENMGKSPNVDKSINYEVAGPAAGTESVGQEERPRSGAPLAPTDAVYYQWKNFGGVIPAGYKSNVMETSTDGKSTRIFATGNWFAARSTNKGTTWTFVDPYSGYPDFCCDQVILHDVARDIYIWERMAVPDASGNNTFKLTISYANQFFVAPYTSWTYTFSPAGINAAWANQWFDYPHMQLGPNYLFLSWNMFNAAGSFVRTLMLKLPLNELAAAAGFSYSYYTNVDWFTFVPVSGASHAMYFASNWDMSAPYDSLAIWRWNEIDNGLVVWVKAVPAWTASGRGDLHCGTPNWLARTDMRLLTGARYNIYQAGGIDPWQPGRKILGWWWNVAEDAVNFAYPYINGAAFYEDTMTLLPGWIGRPYVYGGDCFAYPSFTPNSRGDLGGLFNYSYSPAWERPRVAYTMADDVWGAPPGWALYAAASSLGGPSDAKWGDYNTTRTYQLGTTWIAGTHIIPTVGNCANCSVPLFLAFGRERDRPNYSKW